MHEAVVRGDNYIPRHCDSSHVLLAPITGCYQEKLKRRERFMKLNPSHPHVLDRISMHLHKLIWVVNTLHHLSLNYVHLQYDDTDGCVVIIESHLLPTFFERFTFRANNVRRRTEKLSTAVAIEGHL